MNLQINEDVISETMHVMIVLRLCHPMQNDDVFLNTSHLWIHKDKSTHRQNIIFYDKIVTAYNDASLN